MIRQYLPQTNENAKFSELGHGRRRRASSGPGNASTKHLLRAARVSLAPCRRQPDLRSGSGTTAPQRKRQTAIPHASLRPHCLALTQRRSTDRQIFFFTLPPSPGQDYVRRPTDRLKSAWLCSRSSAIAEGGIARPRLISTCLR